MFLILTQYSFKNGAFLCLTSFCVFLFLQIFTHISPFILSFSQCPLASFLSWSPPLYIFISNNIYLSLPSSSFLSSYASLSFIFAFFLLLSVTPSLFVSLFSVFLSHFLRQSASLFLSLPLSLSLSHTHTLLLSLSLSLHLFIIIFRDIFNCSFPFFTTLSNQNQNYFQTN